MCKQKTKDIFHRGVLVLLICVQILVRLDCFSQGITMEVWKPAWWKTAKIHWNLKQAQPRNREIDVNNPCR